MEKENVDVIITESIEDDNRRLQMEAFQRHLENVGLTADEASLVVAYRYAPHLITELPEDKFRNNPLEYRIACGAEIAAIMSIPEVHFPEGIDLNMDYLKAEEMISKKIDEASKSLAAWYTQLFTLRQEYVDRANRT